MYLVDKVIAIVRRYSLRVSCVKNDTEEMAPKNKDADGPGTGVTERSVGRVKCVHRDAVVDNPSFRL